MAPTSRIPAATASGRRGNGCTENPYGRFWLSVKPYFCRSQGQNVVLLAAPIATGFPLRSSSRVTPGCEMITVGFFWNVAAIATSGTFCSTADNTCNASAIAMSMLAGGEQLQAVDLRSAHADLHIESVLAVRALGHRLVEARRARLARASRSQTRGGSDGWPVAKGAPSAMRTTARRVRIRIGTNTPFQVFAGPPSHLDVQSQRGRAAHYATSAYGVRRIPRLLRHGAWRSPRFFTPRIRMSENGERARRARHNARHDDLDSDSCYRALATHDARFDGRFFVGVRSTRIYCRPVCTVRLPNRENCRFFRSAAAAEVDGFRPCLRCRPELAPGLASVDASAQLRAGGASR